MNFRFYLFLFFIFTLLGCGVKSPPVRYEEVSIPSYINSFTSKEYGNDSISTKVKK